VTGRRASALASVAAGMAALLLPGALAIADVAGPDDTLSTAYGPMQLASPVNGTFTPSETADYLKLVVSTAGVSLRFTVQNTTASCTSTSELPCPVWATLLDGAGQQLGGEGSSAGTGEVDQGGGDVIDWKFDQPGTYYVAVDSAGDNPSYAVRYDLAPAPAPSSQKHGGKHSGPTTPAPSSGVLPGVLEGLIVRSPQRGVVVRARLQIGRPLKRLDVRLLVRRGRSATLTTVGHLVAQGEPAGHITLAVALTRTGRVMLSRAHHLRLKLQVLAAPQTGAAVQLTRNVLVNR
jgi:hypothetical protein